MKSYRLALVALLSSTILLSVASTAHAEPTRAEQSAKLADEATELFRAHDYARANEKYAQAYVLDPDPNLLYNQARCYEAVGDRPAADAKYREFLGKPGGDVSAQKRAKAFADEFARNPAGTVAPVPQPAPVQPGPSTSMPAPSAPGGATSPPAAPSDTTSSSSPLRTAGWITAGVGAAGLLVGTVFALRANSKNNDAEGQCTGNLCTQAGLDLTDQARSSATIATVGFVAGGVLLAGGLGMALLAPKTSSGNAWLAPSVSPNFAGLRLGGSFR
jgi:hypothetical protein